MTRAVLFVLVLAKVATPGGCRCGSSNNPGTDAANPGTDATGPGTDATGPGTDATGPGTDAAGPGTDAAGPGSDAGGSGDPCTTDSDCAMGSEWCVGGSCDACDNSGLLCDIACIAGWSTYVRNGCYPCECAPDNECISDGDCAGAGTVAECYQGAFCWDWCSAGDPSCCFGNTCSAPGCPSPNPEGCSTTGCPVGQSCEPAMGCAPSSCACSMGSWLCTSDCGGGVCI